MAMEKMFPMLLSAGLLMVILGIVLSISAEITSDLTDNIDDSTSITVSNQTYTASFGSVQSLTSCDGTVDSPCQISNVIVTNETSASNYPQNASNWYVNNTFGYIWFESTLCSDNDTIVACPEDDGTTLNVTYTFTGYGLAHSTGINSTTAIGDLAQWSDTVAVVVAAVIIIGLLMASFGSWIYMRKD